jgi:Mlc titration factor MtfA (ptsG expression regulator)
VLLAKFLTTLQRSLAARHLRKSRVPELRWRNAISQASVLQQLSQAEQLRLRELTSQFLHAKAFSGAGDLVLDDDMRILIAAQACLLILELDLSYYNGWHEIIVYPDTFVVRREAVDSAGLVYEARQVLGGEAWSRGPVILSWADAYPGTDGHGEDSNVILHEFAHKLDMLNGVANGMPPLHKTMDRQTWTAVFQQAYDDLQYELTSHYQSGINPYAAENPAEFFAVTTELFFENPQRLFRIYPDLYAQLRLFYRQDPAQR